MSIVGLTTAELLSRMERGELTAVDITTACLERIDAHNESIGAFLNINREGALEQAAAVDEKRLRAKPLGKLAGIPVAIKDALCTKDQPTTCASQSLQNFQPPYDAHVIERLREADAVLIGKANMDEFAMGSSTENSAFQKTKNPWNVDCTPGGSSGGSAAAVAAGMVPLALGSDTGGSIRQPAAYCGVVGMKPTYGRVSRYGLVAFASSLDQVGPFANDVAGAALLTEVISGHDTRDSTSIPAPVPDYSRTLEENLHGLQVGIVKDHLGTGVDPEVVSATERAMEFYEQQGANLVEITLPHSKYSVAAYYLIAPSEASSNLARYDGVHYGHRAEDFNGMIDMYAQSRAEGFGSEVKRRIMLGTFALSQGYYDAYYLKALKIRRLIRNDFDCAFQKVDIILSPVTPTPAFRLGEMVDDPLKMYLTDIYTIGANLAGIPGISIPAGQTENGLPVGLQLLAPPLHEEHLFQVARQFERETEWHQLRPTL